MDQFPDDIYTEAEADSDTLANLGPLAAMAGVWTSTRGLDVAPKADGPKAGVHRELHAAADRRAGQRPAALLRTALPHADLQAGRSGDVSRPGRLLAVGAGHRGTDPDAGHSARPGRDVHGTRRGRREVVHAAGRPRFADQRHRLVPSSNTRSGRTAARSPSPTMPTARGRTNTTRYWSFRGRRNRSTTRTAIRCARSPSRRPIPPRSPRRRNARVASAGWR